MTASIARARRIAMACGITGLVLCAPAAALSPGRFFHAYLFAWVFWIGVPLGCLAILMIQHVTGGAWGLVIRRLLESGTRTIPVMGLLFLPLAFALPTIYLWARPEVVATDSLLQHKAAYLNIPFFLVRTAACFLILSLLVYVLNRWTRVQDETGDPRVSRNLQLLSAGGMLAFVLTMTFASVDWVMSLEPHWFSTIYPLLLMAGQVVSAFCFIIAAAVLLSRFEPLSKAIGPAHMHDLGKLLFTFVMVWAYFALSQFLIIWSANLPEEIPWYLRRLKGGWEWVGISIILIHFALPFGLLLVRRIKRSGKLLMRVAIVIFIMRLVDLYWMMAPGFEEGAMKGSWIDFAAALGMGGLWVFLFVSQLPRLPLLPQRDPYLAEALGHGHE